MVGLIPEGKEVANDNSRQQLLNVSRSISNDLNQEAAAKSAAVVGKTAAGSAVPKAGGQLSMCNRSISTDVSLIGSQLSKQTVKLINYFLEFNIY